MPIGLLFGCLCAVPLILTECECTNRLQCKVITDFGRGTVANTFPAHDITWDFPPQTGEQPLKNRRLLSKRGNASLSKAVRKLGAERPQLILTKLESYSVPAVPTRDELATKAEKMLTKLCTCQGPSPAKPGKDPIGGTCNLYYNDEDVGTVRSWCWIRKVGLDACNAEGIQLFTDETRNFWTEQVCKKPCTCSGHPMSVPHKEKLSPDIVKKAGGPGKVQFGSECARWQTDDPAPWCYVGFDSRCTQRTWAKTPLHHAAGVDNKFEDLRDVAQYWSYIPCQAQAMYDAERECSITIVTASVLLVVLTCASFPMLLVIYTFLQNHCGDTFETHAVFSIEFSDDEEDFDDFDVSNVDSELARAKRFTRTRSSGSIDDRIELRIEQAKPAKKPQKAGKKKEGDGKKQDPSGGTQEASGKKKAKKGKTKAKKDEQTGGIELSARK